MSLAIHLFQIDEISKSKYIEVARAAGSTTPAFDAAIRALEDDWSGDVPPEWAQWPVPLLLSEHALVKIAELADELPDPTERLRAAHRHREGE